MRAIIVCAAYLLTLSRATVTRAQEETCPSEIPASSQERRTRAKEWFSRAEAAEAAKDPVTAVKAYQCSLHMVPHAFTAFNLARLAEKNGDLELAVEAYDTYLKLSPEAPDRVVVTGRIATLSERITELRHTQKPDPSPDPSTETPSTSLPVPGQYESIPDLPPPRPASPSFDNEAPPGLEIRRRPHPAVYVLGGAAIGAVAGGVMLNLGARRKMDECRKLAGDGQALSAADACNAARPRAYASYALLAVAGAAAVADAVVLLISSRTPKNRVGLALLPDGATLRARLAF
jgi:tetratricopeptide (TPR) repeat protein